MRCRRHPLSRHPALVLSLSLHPTRHRPHPPALPRLKDKVKPTHSQIFLAHCIKGMTVKETSELLEVSVNEVYLTKSRVMPLFEEEVRALSAKDEE